MHVDAPSAAAYMPLSQSEHAVAVGVVEYLPAAHLRHELAPALEPVFVIEPAPHLAHDATLELVEYVPLAHAVHLVAPMPVPVSVIEPA